MKPCIESKAAAAAANTQHRDRKGKQASKTLISIYETTEKLKYTHTNTLILLNAVFELKLNALNSKWQNVAKT